MHGPNADVSKVLTCTSCEFETDKIHFLENHINAKHLNEKNFSCNTCGFKSYYRQPVKNHLRSEYKGSKQAKVTKIHCLDCISNISHSTCTQAQKRPEDTLALWHCFVVEFSCHIIKENVQHEFLIQKFWKINQVFEDSFASLCDLPMVSQSLCHYQIQVSTFVQSGQSASCKKVLEMLERLKMLKNAGWKC